MACNWGVYEATNLAMFRSKASNLHVDDIEPKPMWRFFPSLSLSLSLTHILHLHWRWVTTLSQIRFQNQFRGVNSWHSTAHIWSRREDMKYVPPLSPTSGPSLNSCFVFDYLELPGNGLPLTNFSSFPLSNCHKLWSLYFLWFQVVFFVQFYVLMICRSRKIGRPMSSHVTSRPVGALHWIPLQLEIIHLFGLQNLLSSQPEGPLLKKGTPKGPLAGR